MDLPSQLLGVFAVLSLLAFTLWFLKKRGAVRMTARLPVRWTFRRPRANEKLLERVDGLQLSSTHSLSLIRMADRAILIGISPGGFCLVESSPWKLLQTGEAEKLVGQDAGVHGIVERKQVR